MGQGISTYQQFPYVIGQPVTSYIGKSIWTLHMGTKRDDGSSVSIFSFDTKKNPSKIDVARNAFKRSKTIRHPNLLTYLDGIELDTNIYIVTEPIQPLDEIIDDIKKYEDSISWGIYQITKGLSFLSDCNLTHGNLNTTTVFVNKGGDWKLGGLDLVCDIRDGNPFLKLHGDQVPVKYRAPEVNKAQWSTINTSPSYSIDSWMLGCLIYECYSGPMSKSEDVRELASIPKSLHQSYQKCFSSKIDQRLDPHKFLDSPYFSNIFVETCVFLENITLKDNFEKESFFKKMDLHIDKLPINICKFKILPHLITAFEIGPVNTKILGTLLKISSNLSTEEYTTKVVPSVVKWFATDDRALRINLLENLEHYIQHLSPTVINDQIFPNIVNGFNDKPALKELTIKSMLLFGPKLSEKTMIQLLKYFAALQKDMEPGIRTNTTICLGRIAEHISVETRKRVLIPAFSTALKDPFVPSQNAGLSAFMFTQHYYSPEEMATRVIPEISRMLISPEKQVRSTAFQAMSLFIKKLETLSSQMPEIINNQSNNNNQNIINNNNGGSGGSGDGLSPTQQPSQESMLGWAYGLTKKYISQSTVEQPIGGSNNSSINSSPSSTNSISPFTPSTKTSPPINNITNNKTSNIGGSGKNNNNINNNNNSGWDDDDEEEEDDFEESSPPPPPKKNVQPLPSPQQTNPSTKGKAMQLVPKKVQTTKTSGWGDEDDDLKEQNNSTGGGGWGDWNNEPIPNNNNNSTMKKKSKPQVAPSSSKDGWEDWDD